MSKEEGTRDAAAVHRDSFFFFREDGVCRRKRRKQFGLPQDSTRHGARRERHLEHTQQRGETALQLPQ